MPTSRVAGADTDLSDLRLFLTPERRAAIDGVAPAPPPDPIAPKRAPTPPSRAATGPRRVPAARAGTLPPGSATLRSARGTSRIVDGVPERAGPS